MLGDYEKKYDNPSCAQCLPSTNTGFFVKIHSKHLCFLDKNSMQTQGLFVKNMWNNKLFSWKPTKRKSGF